LYFWFSYQIWVLTGYASTVTKLSVSLLRFRAPLQPAGA
jgi:hypothetical protein